MTDGVDGDALSAPVARRGPSWPRRLAGPGAFLVLLAVLCLVYLRLSQTYPENSDEANILLMADDMRHGNLFLSGWHVSDVPFITTELPQMAVLVAIFGLRLGTAHIAAAVTYTLMAGFGMLLARGRARGVNAVVRMAVAMAIMLAPQPGVGVFVADFSVGHIGTSVPVMVTWLILDRAPRRWWLPAVVALLLAWAEIADPLVLVVAIMPLLAVCLVRMATALAYALRGGAGESGGEGEGDPALAARLRAALASRWLELSLVVAGGVGYAIAWAAGRELQRVGYQQNPVPFQLQHPGRWFMQARIVVHGVLEIFGAYFVPGNQEPKAGAPIPNPGVLDQVIAFSHLVGVALAVWGVCAIVRRFFRRDADFVSQLLLAGIIANLAAYIMSTLGDHSALNVREVAPVLPFAAVLAARMLGDRLLGFARGGPLLRVTARGRQFGLRATAAALAALMAFWVFGLARQASAPAAPPPFASLVAHLETQHLTYGVSGYWNASVITVESGGKVTIRAVSPSCLQPYQWETKTEWYDPGKHDATFVLLDNAPGYFTHFNSSVAGLVLLNNWYGIAVKHEFGSHYMSGGYPVYQYEVRSYSGNVLSAMPKLAQQIPHPANWLAKTLRSEGQPVNGVCS